MKHSFKLALRNLVRQRTGSVINISGLSISLAACLIILLFIQNEISFDKQNKHYGEIYRLLKCAEGQRMPNHPMVFFKALQDNIPELQNGTTIQIRGGSSEFIKLDNHNFFFDGIVFTTPDFFRVFTASFIQGDPVYALSAPAKVVLTESSALRMFGSTNPVGQSIRFRNKYDLEVTGVIKDIPKTSHFIVDMLVSAETLKGIDKFLTESWNNSSTSFYFVLPPSTDCHQLEQKIKTQFMAANGIKKMKTIYQLQPLSEIHLYSADTLWDIAIRGDIRVVKSFAIIAFFILCIACFNYINLSLALSGKSDFITVIQKTMGAGKRDIFTATITESLLLIVICSSLAILITFLFLPYFNQIMGTSLQISFSPGRVFLTLASLSGFAVLIPSLFQSWFRIHVNPSMILAGNRNKFSSKMNKGYSWISKSMLILQLTISIGLIASVIIVFRQTSLLIDQRLGFNKNRLLEMALPDDESTAGKYRLLKDKYSGLPEVGGFGASWNTPAENINNYGPLEVYGADGQLTRVNFGQVPVDGGYLPTIEPRFIYGKGFDPSLRSDSSKIIINRAGMDALGIKNPVGKKVKNFFTGDPGKTYEIAGVVENIQYESFHEAPQPACFFLSSWNLSSIILRLNPGDVPQTLKKLERIWNSIEPGVPFQYRFINDKLLSNYKKEIRMKNVLTAMTLIAIFISMLGVFGLGLFISRSRTKEIGIRKVNGATVFKIMVILNKDFLKWVALAFVIATPLTFFAMKKWLENFTCKTGLGWWIFALSGLLIMLISLFTLSWQSYRVAISDPVESLKYE